MKWDAYTVAVVFATGAAALAAAAATGALIGGGIWLAMHLEDRAQARNAETTRGMR